MKEKQILKNDILQAIDRINDLEPNDNLEVLELFTNLTRRFRNLKESDFVIKSHYDIYLKSLRVSSVLYDLEVRALSNKEDYATSENYFQIKMSLIGHLGWLDENY